MARLTLEQRARRNTTRKNNRIKRLFPMLAEQMLLSIDDERARLLEQLERFENIYKPRLRSLNKELWKKAFRHRVAVLGRVPKDQLREYDAKWASCSLPIKPEYYTHYWWTLARVHNQPYCDANCPHIARHELLFGKYGEQCPVCGWESDKEPGLDAEPIQLVLGE